MAQRRAIRDVLLLCTAAKIAPESKGRLSRILAEGVDWEHLLHLAEFHGVAPLVAHNLVGEGWHHQIPQSYRERFERTCHSTLYKNVVLSTELTKILSAFNHRGIAVIPLKGTTLAEALYDNPALRVIADMDILVHPGDIPQARELLTGLGYQQMPQQPHRNHHFHEVPYYKQAKFPFFVELHWDLEDRTLAAVPEQAIWRRARPLELPGISAKVLSPEDNLLFLIVHLSKHSSQLLKFLSDIAELLKKYQDTLNWDYIVASARSWETGTAAYHTLKRAQDLLGAPVPARVLETLKPGLWRRGIIGFIQTRESFITPIKGSGLRDWTSVLARGLMMRHWHQTWAVLSRQQGSWKRAAWLKTAVWVALVLIVALWRNSVGVVLKQR
jgi:hypothetical protein